MKRLKRSLCGILAAGLLYSLPAMAETFLAYERPEAGVKLKYPADWIKSESLPGVLVAFGVPKEKANLKMVENIALTVQELPADMSTLETYTSMYEKQREKDPNPPKVIESKKTKLGGQPAQSIVCIGKQNGLEIQFWQVWTIKDAKAYLFTYGAEKKTYKNFLKEAERITASFIFTKPAAAPKKVS